MKPKDFDSNCDELYEKINYSIAPIIAMFIERECSNIKVNTLLAILSNVIIETLFLHVALIIKQFPEGTPKNKIFSEVMDFSKYLISQNKSPFENI